MERTKTWILVADAARARLFEKGRRGLKPIGSFDHAASRERVRDLVSDAEGRKPSGRSGRPYEGRPGAAPDTDPKEVEANRFARELADGLARGLGAKAYEALVLVAPPHFLGELKRVLDPEVERRVAKTIDKDLTRIGLDELPRHLDAA